MPSLPMCLAITAVAFALAVAPEANAKRIKPKSAESITKAAESLRRQAEVSRERSEREAMQNLEPLKGFAESISSTPDVAKAFLIDWLPTQSHGFENVFGDFRTTDSVAASRTINSRSAFGGAWAAPNSLSEMAKVLEQVKDTSKFIIIRGHNVDGKLRLPHSESMPASIRDIGLICKAKGLFCIFLSCSSKNFLDPINTQIGLARDLTIEKSLELTEFIREALNSMRVEIESNKDSAFPAVQRFAERLLRETDSVIHPRIYLVVLNGIIVGILVSDDDEPRSRWSQIRDPEIVQLSSRQLRKSIRTSALTNRSSGIPKAGK